MVTFFMACSSLTLRERKETYVTSNEYFRIVCLHLTLISLTQRWKRVLKRKAI